MSISQIVTISEVAEFTGVTVTDPQIVQAQVIVFLEARANPTLEEVGNADAYWLKMAVSFQAAWMTQQFGLHGRNDVTSANQGGMSMSFNGDSGVYLAPIAKKAVNNVSWRRSRTTGPGWDVNTLNPQVNDDLYPWVPLDI